MEKDIFTEIFVNTHNDIHGESKVDMLTKGIKTSELWVVLLLIGSNFLSSTGVDVSIVTDGVLTASEQVAEIAQQLQEEEHSLTGPSTTWLALAYVVGRTLLKWRELGKPVE